VSNDSAGDQQLSRPERRVLLDVGTPQPMKAMAFNSWPLIAGVLVVSYLVAMFFPAIGGLLLITIPIVVVAALVVGGLQAKKIRLTVTDDVIKVSNGKSGNACDRSHVQSAVLVERFARRKWSPRTTTLILLDRDGRNALLLSGLLWPPAVLDQVIDLMPGVPVERLEGTQSPYTLAARYPKILQNTDGTEKGPSRE